MIQIVTWFDTRFVFLAFSNYFDIKLKTVTKQHTLTSSSAIYLHFKILSQFKIDFIQFEIILQFMSKMLYKCGYRSLKTFNKYLV